MDSSDLLVSIAEVGKLFYQTMLSRLDSGNYPPSADDPRGFSSIQKATSVRSPMRDANGVSIEIVISLGLAPYARAYEWGSGVHSEKNPETITIRPRNAPEMVFPEGDWPGWQDWGTAGAVPYKGFFFLTHVEHPGVDAKPYIEPTIEEIHDQVRKKLAHDFKVSWLKDGKMVEVV